MDCGGSNKREHCAEGLPYERQSKVLVSERLMNERDATRMQEVHARTTQKLFEGARSAKSALSQQRVPSSEHFSIRANGEIQMRSFTKDDNMSEMARAEAKCCTRKSYISTDCSDCQMPLCEFCGYSCVECGSFLCSGCVSLFGRGTVDRPTCERCMLFNKQ